MHFAVPLCLTLITVSLVFQILSLVSTPISSISLSSYSGLNYGVFGYCDESTDSCSPRKLGYTPHVESSSSGSHRQVALPSSLRFSVTKLLVVHPLSFAVTLILYGLLLLINHRHLASSTGFLLTVALFSLPTFLFSLLCFLVDIMLFSSHLRWPGWLMLPSTILIAVCCSLIWNVRRTVSIKNYEALQEARTAASVETYAMSDWPVHEPAAPNNPLLEPEITYTSTFVE